MGLFSFLTGGSKSESKSWNDAAPWVNKTYQPMAGTGTQAVNALAALLGVGGDQAGQQAAFDTYKRSTGYNAVMDAAMRGISGSNAARGLVQSGANLKAMQDRAADIGDTYFGRYESGVNNLANLGLNAGQLVVGANQRSTGKSESGGGLFGALGGIGRAIGGFAALCDARAKTDIEKIGEEPDGLGIYRFRYLFDDQVYVGPMADEVAQLRPWALGPKFGDWQTVMMEAA